RYDPPGPQNPLGMATRLLAGCTTGAVAVACAQPTDVVKVRFQASRTLSDSARRYSGTVDAYRTIAREEGIRGLWRGTSGQGGPWGREEGWGQGWGRQGWGTCPGCSRRGCEQHSQCHSPLSRPGTLPNIARNAIINCGELVTYDLLKDALLRAQLMAGEFAAGGRGRVPSLSLQHPTRGSSPPPDNVPCHFVAAFGAGFCATVVASPVDVVKTRYMNASPGQYRNALSCLLALLTQDGPAGLYKGFVPSFLRLGSWNVVMFVSYEQLQRALVLARPALS
uniref:Uncoupling protein 3 n=1 Tax=Cyanoderma ruficeps TaxID=181631 RepID=A0A8C3NTH4_9PASS